MSLFISTTGTEATVLFQTLGGIELVHPVIDLDLDAVYRLEELYNNRELQNSLDRGEITISRKPLNAEPVNLFEDDPYLIRETGTFGTSDTRVLTGNITIDLVTEDFAYYWIDPGVQNRNVNINLPSDVPNKVVHFGNNTTGTSRFFIREAGTFLKTVQKNQVVQLQSDGTQWYVITLV